MTMTRLATTQTTTARSNVHITFRGVPIDEELFHYIRRRALGWRRAWVVVEARGRQVDVRVTTADGSALRSDPDSFLAARNAFDLLEADLHRSSLRVETRKEYSSCA